MSAVSVSKTCKVENAKSMATLCVFGIMLSMSVFLLDTNAFAESTETTVTRLDDKISLERTTTVMSIPENNTLPWGAIKGKVNDPSQGYPVIIQIFKSLEDDPIHVAQVSLKGDNSFEHKFRVLLVDDEGKTTHFFEGYYYVRIFKVVDTPRDDLDSA